MKLEVEITNEDILVALMRSNTQLFSDLHDSVRWEIHETIGGTIKDAIKAIVDLEIKDQLSKMDGISKEVEYEMKSFIKNRVATLMKKEFPKE